LRYIDKNKNRISKFKSLIESNNAIDLASMGFPENREEIIDDEKW
jgi:hypothetical protein